MSQRSAHNVPSDTWETLRTLFGTQQLAGLLGVSASSVRLYASSQRPTPGPVTARLRWLSRVVEHLDGTYNEEGIRNWFTRSRQALGGHTPQSILRDEADWSPEADVARQIEALARAGTGMTAT